MKKAELQRECGAHSGLKTVCSQYQAVAQRSRSSRSVTLLAELSVRSLESSYSSSVLITYHNWNPILSLRHHVLNCWQKKRKHPRETCKDNSFSKCGLYRTKQNKAAWMFVSKMLPSKNTAQSQESLQYTQLFQKEDSKQWCSILKRKVWTFSWA